MTTLQIIVLAIVQGLTEFLPVSSSAHLALVPYVFHWPDQGMAFDVALHLGTLLAVLWYFRKQLCTMACEWSCSLVGKGFTDASRLSWPYVELYCRAPIVIAVTTIIFGLLLGLADHYGTRRMALSDIHESRALGIGLAQIMSLIPGVSRSGITMTAGLSLGLTRVAAAQFSFLMSIPVILGAVVLTGHDVLQAAEPLDVQAFGLGITISMVTGLCCIHGFMRWISKVGFRWFAVYRVVLGLALLFTLSS